MQVADNRRASVDSRERFRLSLAVDRRTEAASRSGIVATARLSYFYFLLHVLFARSSYSGFTKLEYNISSSLPWCRDICSRTV